MMNFIKRIISKLFGIFNSDAPITSEEIIMTKHSCQGLNNCKNQGFSGSNNCAGAGTCSTANNHDCQTDNNCRYQGGCGYPGKSSTGQPEYNVRQNSCKGLGGCQAPISPLQYFNKGKYAGEETWKVARKLFEENYTGSKPILPVGPVTERRKALTPTSPKAT